MSWGNHCQLCKQIRFKGIQDSFWYYYWNKNIWEMLRYAFAIMDRDFEPYVKDNVIKNLQTFLDDFRFDHLLFSRKKWTEQERIEYFMLSIFLHDYEKKMITVENLLKLRPREFEVFCSDILSQLGYKNVKVTSYTRDGGFDFSCKINGVDVLGMQKVQSKNKSKTRGS